MIIVHRETVAETKYKAELINAKSHIKMSGQHGVPQI